MMTSSTILALAALLGTGCAQQGHLISGSATEQLRPCSELQHAVINHCAAHCNTCDTANTDTVLGDCVVTELWGENVLGTTKATEDCLEEQLDTEAAEAAAAEARRADNLCSALQHAVINHCINHCGTCDVPTTETVLGSCELEGPWGLIEGSDGTRIMAAAQVSSVCGEQLNAAQHRASNHCTELQHAVINHCAAHCGTCDVAKTDVILGDCVVDEIGGTVLGTAKVAEDCAGEQLVAEAHHEDSMCNDLQRSVISHCINHCDTCEFHGKGRTDLILDGCEVEATDGTHIKGAVRAAQVCGELSEITVSGTILFEATVAEVNADRVGFDANFADEIMVQFARAGVSLSPSQVSVRGIAAGSVVVSYEVTLPCTDDCPAVTQSARQANRMALAAAAAGQLTAGGFSSTVMNAQPTLESAAVQPQHPDGGSPGAKHSSGHSHWALWCTAVMISAALVGGAWSANPAQLSSLFYKVR